MAQGGYTKEMDRIIASLEGRPRLLLHACCAPCSSAVLELLDRHFELTIFITTPISPLMRNITAGSRSWNAFLNKRGIRI